MRKHVFISHHHRDDVHVDNLVNLLGRSNHDFRNSSIRTFKDKNRERIINGQVSDNVIRRLIRRRMKWASTLIVLIGKSTHSRDWVNWEIEEAMRQGKRIVGVFIHGATDADIPPALVAYRDSIVGWNTQRIIASIEGESYAEGPDGQPLPPNYTISHSQC